MISSAADAVTVVDAAAVAEAPVEVELWAADVVETAAVELLVELATVDDDATEVDVAISLETAASKVPVMLLMLRGQPFGSCMRGRVPLGGFQSYPFVDACATACGAGGPSVAKQGRLSDARALPNRGCMRGRLVLCVAIAGGSVCESEECAQLAVYGVGTHTPPQE